MIVMTITMMWHDDDCYDKYDEHDGDIILMTETGGHKDDVLSGKDRRGRGRVGT